MRKFKQLLSMLLILGLMFTMLPYEVIALTFKNKTTEKANFTEGVSTVEELDTRLTWLMDKYVDTAWTSTGKKCSNHSTYCYSKYYYGYQCKGFASYIFNDLFRGGHIGPYSSYYKIPNPKNATLIGACVDIYSSDAEKAKSLLMQAQPGDFIQAHPRARSYAHSMIVVATDADGIYLLDCNSDGHCSVKSYYQTWSKFATRNEDFSLFHSTLYPSDARYDPSGSVESVTGGICKLSVSGWTFDRDDLTSSLKVKVLVGGECVATINADKERTDLEASFPSVGTNHGFEAEIDIPERLTGTQTVELVAVDVGGGNDTSLAATTVEITPVKVSELKIDTLPDKTTYYAGEVLTTAGLKLTAVYNDGSTVALDSGYECDTTILGEEGNITVTLTYEGVSAVFTVSVLPPVKGDVNADGIVNNRDAVIILQILAGWDVNHLEGSLDVNGDTYTTNRDAARLLQYLAGWNVELN